MIVDVQATFLGNASKSDLIKQIGKLCLRRDPNLPKRLSDDQRLQAHRHLDIFRIQKEKDDLKQRLQEEFGSIRNGSKSLEGLHYTRLQSKLRALNLRCERESFIQILRDFHSAADLDHMVSQLSGEEPASKILSPVSHILEERSQLAHALFQPTTESSFVEMVEVMTRFCSLSEGKQRCHSHEIDVGNRTIEPSAYPQGVSSTGQKSLHNHNVIEAVLGLDAVKEVQIAEAVRPAKSRKPTLKSPSKITKGKKSPNSLTCLFCHGNPKRGRTQNFARTDSLRRHYRQVHFQYQVGPFPCPLSDCMKIIHDSDHFANHAVTIHDSDLGVWARITEALKRTTKPGQLASFVL